MNQYEAFKRLSDEGRSVADIASTFGVTELMVKRRLALANLIPEIRKAYAAEEIDGNTITALTLATENQQREWFDLWNDDDADYVPTGRQLKAWLLGGEHISTDKALFDLDKYHGYAGLILTDLFGECSVFADAATFWKCQNEALAAKVEEFKAEGWADVTLLDKGRYFAKWDHVARSKEDGGKVFVEVRDSGEVTFHEGYLDSKDAARSDKANASGGDGETENRRRPARISKRPFEPLGRTISGTRTPRSRIDGKMSAISGFLRSWRMLSVEIFRLSIAILRSSMCGFL